MSRAVSWPRCADKECPRAHGHDYGKPGRVVLLAQVEVEPGGWYEGPWLTPKAVRAAEKRWVERSMDTRPPEDDGIVAQCGGCKFFAALGGDYGLCWNAKSQHDGRVVFEHGGCSEHFGLTRGGR